MHITVENYLETKGSARLEDYEEKYLVTTPSANDTDNTLSVKALRGLYTHALANANKDFKYARTIASIDALTGDDNSFKRIQALIGAPRRRNWGMSGLHLAFEVNPFVKSLKKY